MFRNKIDVSKAIHKIKTREKGYVGTILTLCSLAIILMILVIFAIMILMNFIIFSWRGPFVAGDLALWAGIWGAVIASVVGGFISGGLTLAGVLIANKHTEKMEIKRMKYNEKLVFMENYHKKAISLDEAYDMVKATEDTIRGFHNFEFVELTCNEFEGKLIETIKELERINGRITFIYQLAVQFRNNNFMHEHDMLRKGLDYKNSQPLLLMNISTEIKKERERIREIHNKYKAENT